MKLLMHTCCAPCSIYCIDSLREEGIEPTVYWFNPNIHPYQEYKMRRDTLKEYTQSIGIQSIFEENYGLDDFCRNVVHDLSNRCQNYCYPFRLEQTAKYAKEHGYEAFTTTLLVSIYQNHEAIIKIANQMAEKYEIPFLYRDFRVGFRKGQDRAKELGLYRQKYCGCIFSEEIANDNRIVSDAKVASLHNKETEKRIRLGWSVPNLALKPYKNGNQDEIQFIYKLKKQVYQKYVESIWGEWNEENQKKLFGRFMKENSKNIKLIYSKEELVGFYNAKDSSGVYEIGNICIKPEFQNKGIGTVILREILGENKDKEIILQCFKENPVMKLYEKMGFKKINETETHYIMKKEIKT